MDDELDFGSEFSADVELERIKERFQQISEAAMGHIHYSNMNFDLHKLFADKQQGQ